MRVEAIGVVEEVAERAAARLLQAEGEQVLRADVGVHQAQMRIEHDDAGGEDIEQVRGIEVRQRGRDRGSQGHGAPRPRAARQVRRRGVSADAGGCSAGWPG